MIHCARQLYRPRRPPIRLAAAAAMGCALATGCRGPWVELGDSGLLGGSATGDHAVIATAAIDYATGTLATVGLDGSALRDNLVPVSGDPAVSADDGLVMQIDRLGRDTLALLDPWDLARPRWQRELGEGSNPHEAVICADKLFVTLNSRDAVGVYRLSDGAQLGAVDLSAFADGDGVGPEPSTMVEHDGSIVVALQRLDQAADWVDRGGQVVQIDCASEQLIGSWAAGANPSVHPWDGDRVLVSARAFEGDPGGLGELDLATGTLSWLVEADALGGAPAGAAVLDHTALVATLADDLTGYSLLCVDLVTAQARLVEFTDSFVTAVERAPDGVAWVALHWGWADPDHAFAGLRRFDLPSCEVRDPAVLPDLGPYDLAFVDG